MVAESLKQMQALEGCQERTKLSYLQLLCTTAIGVHVGDVVQQTPL